MDNNITASVSAPSRHYWLHNPVKIDRTQVQRNKAGEAVPFDKMKTCTKCNEEKNLWDDFHYRASSSDLHQTWCKVCSNGASKKKTEEKALANQGGKLVKVPSAITIHVGQGVRIPERVAPHEVPVVTQKDEVAPVIAEVLSIPTQPPVEEAPVITQPPVAQETIEQPSGIVGVSEQKPRIIFSSFVSFQDWVTDPESAKTTFMTRGYEALVSLRPDGMCYIATPNQSGPGRWIDAEIAAYILKLLTGDPDDDFYGILYR